MELQNLFLSVTIKKLFPPLSLLSQLHRHKKQNIMRVFPFVFFIFSMCDFLFQTVNCNVDSQWARSSIQRALINNFHFRGWIWMKLKTYNLYAQIQFSQFFICELDLVPSIKIPHFTIVITLPDKKNVSRRADNFEMYSYVFFDTETEFEINFFLSDLAQCSTFKKAETETLQCN